MDFNQLLAKMNELSKPAPATTAVVEEPVVAQECGEMPPAPMGDMHKPDTPPPSMSVNLNAQGLDNIEELLSLIKAVNPDADKPAMPMGGTPTIEIEPMDKPGGNMPKLGGLGNLGNLDAGPLKMLPDLDADNDDMPGGELDGADDVSKAQGDLDNDGDHDMDDHDMEKKDKDEGYDKRDAYERDFDASQTGFGPREREDDEGEDESFANSVAGSEPEVKGVDAAIPNGNDLNKEKQMSKHSYRQGDNPMAMEGEELRAWIKGELAQRLAEVKGAK